MRGVGLLFITIVVVLGVLAGAFFLLQRRLIYFPLGVVLPAAAVLPGAEEVTFVSTDGIRLAGWFVKPPGVAPPYRTVLVFNGNGGNRSFRAPLAARLSEEGFAVLLWDYRGYGGNAGSPSEQGLIRDALAARAYLVERADVDPAGVVYLGESLGGAVATALAAQAPPAALILRSPFASLVDVGRHHYPFLPVGLLLRDRFDSESRIAGLECPVLIFAGDRDRIVPLASSRRLYEAAPEGRRELVVISGADHNDELWLVGDEMIDAIVELLGT